LFSLKFEILSFNFSELLANGKTVNFLIGSRVLPGIVAILRPSSNVLLASLLMTHPIYRIPPSTRHHNAGKPPVEIDLVHGSDATINLLLISQFLFSSIEHPT
jgi:hypothetical protein